MSGSEADQRMASHEQTLNEDELRRISRSIKEFIPATTSHLGQDDKLNKFIELFRQVVQTCFSNSISSTHQVAAWNTLCAFLDRGVASENSNVRELLWSHGFWMSALELFLERSQNARPKSSKQLLVSLSNALLKSESPGTASQPRSRVVRLLVTVLLKDDVRSQGRPALTLLAHLLRKDIVTLHDIHHVVSECTLDDYSSISSSIQMLLQRSVIWVVKADAGTVSGQLISVLLDKAHSKIDDQDVLGHIWMDPIRDVMESYPDHVDQFRVHIFPVIFGRTRSAYFQWLHVVGLESLLGAGRSDTAKPDARKEGILLASLQAGKDMGAVMETTSEDLHFTADVLLLPTRKIGRLICRSSRTTRLAGLSLIIDSSAMSKPFNSLALKILRQNLPHLHADTDANFRGELFSRVQRMLDRMRAASAVLARQVKEASSQTPPADESLGEIRNFLAWYHRFLIWELRPSASYQRHISALRCFHILMRSGLDQDVTHASLSKSAQGNTKWPYHIRLLNAGTERLLFDLLLNPFDDVRQVAATILHVHVAAAGLAEEHQRHLLTCVLPRAEQLVHGSGRADHADGVAHIYSLLSASSERSESGSSVLDQLLDKIEQQLDIARRDLALAIERYPLHGLLTSLRYILARADSSVELNEYTFKRFQTVLEGVWQVVRPVLCSDAPEGYVPDELEETSEISTKDMLSYCWRALKEASLLIGAIVQATPPTLTKEQSDSVQALTQLTFSQLAELRHRGAFSTVAQTWTTCCLRISTTSGDTSLSGWYQQVLSLLSGRLTINTRRSAGLPSLICGILISDQSTPLIQQAVNDLEQISRLPVDPSLSQGGSLPQVHAMNCLKDILKNTRLAEHSTPYVLQALQLAADSLLSSAWALRNCGLMLFRAVVDRTLGTNDAYLDYSAKAVRLVDFKQNSRLLDLVISLLRPLDSPDADLQNLRFEGVFPALQLLQRADLPDDQRQSVQRSVFALTSTPSWHVRDKAARTYASMVPANEVDIELQRLLKTSTEQQNALHGALLCAKYLLQRQHAGHDADVKLSNQSLGVVDSRVAAMATPLSNPCPMTRNAFASVKQSAMSIMGPVSIEDLASENTELHKNVVSVLPPSSLGVYEALEQVPNGDQADQWFQARSSYIEQRAKECDGIDERLNEALTDWIQASELSMTTSSVFSREAVAKGCCILNIAYAYVYRHSASQAIFRRICLVVYDLLNDDDEEIRNWASESACKILACDNKLMVEEALVSLVAGRRLLQLLIGKMPDDLQLTKAAGFRAFGLSDRPGVCIREVLDRAQEQDCVLFAEEKQNLYIDDALEVKSWTKTLLQMAPSSFSSTWVHGLATWAEDGLDALLEKTDGPSDGPLGWSTTDDVFVLGLQVIFSVEVSLHLVGKGLNLPVRPSVLRSKLAQLAQKGQEKELNCLWLQEIERVLTTTIALRLTNLHSILKTVSSTV